MQNMNSVTEMLGLSNSSILMMPNKDTNPLSMALFTIFCTVIIANVVATLQDLYSCFCFILQLFSSRNKYRPSNADAASSEPCIREDHVIKSTGTTLIKGDIAVVMENLGIPWDSFSRGDGVDGDISNLFDERGPTLEEAKEAFDLFDSDKDGYFDANDLKRILRALGFVGFSESECQKMIMAFDTNSSVENSGIDFGNFVKIIEGSNIS